MQNSMRFLIALIVVAISSAFAADQAKPAPIAEIRQFSAVVDALIQRSQYAGKAISTGAIDPRFVIKLSIKQPDGNSIARVYEIHSPSLLFGNDDPVGKTYEFEEHVTHYSNGISDVRLQVVRK